MFGYTLLLVQTLVLCACAAGCLGVYRFIARRSRAVSALFALGFLLRALSGLALFAIAYFDLPVLSRLHTPDGFWALAPDAAMYGKLASGPIGAIGFDLPSPAFIATLAVWFRLSGGGAASPLMFNLLCYTASVALIVVAVGRLSDEAGRYSVLVTVGSFSLSPVLILLASQALKDCFFDLLMVIGVVLGCVVLRDADVSPRSKAFPWAVLGLLISIAFVGGIRAYYGVLLWIALAVGTLLLGRRALRGRRWRPLATMATILVGMWFCFMLGSGPYYRSYGDLLTRVIGFEIPVVSTGLSRLPWSAGGSPRWSPEEFSSALYGVRRGYEQTPGGTNIVLARGLATTSFGRTAYGAMSMLIPISVLEMTGLVTVEGGRGLLAVTDLDTLFIDVTLALTIFTVLRQRRLARRAIPQISFVVVLSVVSGLLIGYVVVNYGTLFRFRLMSIASLWLVPVAIDALGGLSLEVRPRAEAREIPHDKGHA